MGRYAKGSKQPKVYPRQCGTGRHTINGSDAETKAGGCKECQRIADARRRRGQGMAVFRGSPTDWHRASRSETDVHPWVLRAARQQRERELEQAMAHQDLRVLGIDGRLDDVGSDAAARDTVDRYIEANRLEHAGVDRVLHALDRGRYLREESDHI